ncbi:hypothetical protein BH10PSE17_BH10PSE17_09030 [soil metagenome]
MAWQAPSCSVTAYLTVLGLLEPESLEQREKRAIPGIEQHYSITRTGRVWSVARQAFLKSPHDVLLMVDDDQIYAKTPLLVAITWLSADERAAIRLEFDATSRERWLSYCVGAAAAHGVGYPAMQWVGLLPESAFRPVVPMHERFGQVLPEPEPGAWSALGGWGDVVDR